jgi:hypothetical protein
VDSANWRVEPAATGDHLPEQITTAGFQQIASSAPYPEPFGWFAPPKLTRVRKPTLLWNQLLSLGVVGMQVLRRVAGPNGTHGAEKTRPTMRQLVFPASKGKSDYMKNAAFNSLLTWRIACTHATLMENWK